MKTRARRRTRMPAPEPGRARKLTDATRRLRRDVEPMTFGAPVAYVYNPLDYARRPYAAYLRRWGATPKRTIFLGMNPGPFGMAQTGVPFGEVGWVRDWLGIEEPVRAPARAHPKRPVTGFACTRSEVSGSRLWGAIAERFGTPERFFADHWIGNYCPLAFVEASGRNRTPDKLPASERDALFAACDRHLQRIVSILEPRFVVGIGAFAAARAADALAGRDVEVDTILHPSPANPRANAGWQDVATRQLEALGIWSR